MAARFPARLPSWLLAPPKPRQSQWTRPLCHSCPPTCKPRASAHSSFSSSPAASFSTSAQLYLKPMPPRPKPPPEEEIEESFVKGTGPGGQKINKTNSAVQLTHIPTGIVVKSQATRSRSQNRLIARQQLALRLDELRNGDQSRTAIVGASKFRKRASADKKSRRKYRKLAEETEAAKQADGGSEDVQATVKESEAVEAKVVEARVDSESNGR